MSKILEVDYKWVAAGAVGIAITTGAAIYSTYKYKSIKNEKVKENVYESQKYLSEYLVYSYGKPDEILTWSFGPRESLDFPRRCAELCLKHFEKKDGVPCRALDIGCAVGRSSFEMTKGFDEVIGIDFSQAFIDACNTLKNEGKLSYNVTTVGDLTKALEAQIDPVLDRSKTIFQQGDACNLSPNLGQFGCVLAANLVDRLHSPKQFLNRLASLVASGGILVLTTPYTFLRDFTPVDKWIGGYKTSDGKEISGFEGLKKVLAPAFDFVADQDMPFFIRETERKNQWTVAHATVWLRKT